MFISELKNLHCHVSSQIRLFLLLTMGFLVVDGILLLVKMMCFDRCIEFGWPFEYFVCGIVNVSNAAILS